MNLHAQDIPNAANFLPGPPSTLSMKYVNDFADYSWGVDQRSTSRGTQAKSDMGWDLDDFLPVYSSLLGVNITKNNTPNIYQVLPAAQAGIGSVDHIDQMAMGDGATLNHQLNNKQ